MKRVIVDYAKLTNEILTLLVERFPDGYDDSDVIRFKNAKNETVEAVEVRTEDTIYLVKVSTKLADRIENFDEDDEDIAADDAIDIKGLDIEDGDDEEVKKPKAPKVKKNADGDDDEDDDEDDDDYDDDDEDRDYDDEDEDEEDED
ncbi:MULTISPECIES: DNA primase [unclassified Flavobacterium]|uniref:DNA primase n=1 Tax=unclassified Flavobacterium TaxID=196869 RepID=UPI00095D5B15|nr:MULTISPECIES: DNA primase [unclassified Flavobacterium]MBN9285937.1 DNA primase [Flavobacterium sp.]OJV69561.1 MAG: DNA primase [Flavobacterium sp. 40-81]